MRVSRRRVTARSQDPQLSKLASVFSHYRLVDASLEATFLVALLESIIFYLEDEALLHYYCSRLLLHCEKTDVSENGRLLKDELRDLLLGSNASSVDQLVGRPEFMQTLEFLANSLLTSSDTSQSSGLGLLERLAFAVQSRLVILTSTSLKNTVKEFGPRAELMVFFLETDTKHYFLYPRLGQYSTLEPKQLAVQIESKEPAQAVHRPALQLVVTRKGTTDLDILAESNSNAGQNEILKPTTRESYSGVGKEEMSPALVDSPTTPPPTTSLNCCASFLHDWWPGIALCFGVLATACIIWFAVL